jgi:hypothetical protein
VLEIGLLSLQVGLPPPLEHVTIRSLSVLHLYAIREDLTSGLYGLIDVLLHGELGQSQSLHVLIPDYMSSEGHVHTHLSWEST